MRTLRTLGFLALLGAVGIAAQELVASVLTAAPFDVKAPPSGAKDEPEDHPSRPSACVVTAKTTEISAQEAGQIKEFKVEEGDEVSERDLLALIDDSQVQVARKAANYKLQAAVAEAGNKVTVLYAKKGRDIAEIEYKQAQETQKLFDRAVTLFELRRLYFKVEEANLNVEESEHKLSLAAIAADARRAEMEAADLDVKRREIRAPVIGKTDVVYRVEKRHREVGEWVKPGDPVLQLLRLDVVYVQGDMDAHRLTPADVQDRPVRVTVTVKGQSVTFEGKVVFASSKVDGRGRSQVKAEVANRKINGQRILRDGIEAEMKITGIELKR